ncbi:sensor histidine kinase [Candidatus Nitrosocosmicus hydrocola]|uniref:sensor histidine kinase n=1 Tax=Candidatus Nitrosocosmicus hydrocola TaxID=1826872 RepID=UPI0011E5A2E2|nr:sensor histidine kinase [Candidatus Nitrosocosmicus hydrocola]
MLKIHLVSLALIISLVIVSNIIYFYLQEQNEKNALDSLLVQHVSLQNQSAKSITNSIGSDLNSMLKMIENVAQMEAMKNIVKNDSQLSDGKQQNASGYILGFLQDQIKSTYDDLSKKADRLYILDKNDVVIESYAPPGEDTFIGLDLSFRDYVNKTKETQQPVYSDFFKGADGINRITITYPVFNKTEYSGQNMSLAGSVNSIPNKTTDSETYLGLVAASVPVSQLFERYGNIFNVESQYLVAYDKNGTIMVSPRTEFIGMNYLSPEIQQVTDSNGIYNRIVSNLINGKQDQGLYTTDLGERYNTAFPVLADNKTVYGLSVVTPTNSIYEDINELMRNERIQSALLFITMSAGVIIIIVILRNWSKDLGKEVKKRTLELNEANHRLEIVNEKIIASEKAKEEFISMVSHELRTPLMPIKAYAGMLLKPKYTGELNPKQKKAIESILRNVTSMERLVGDVLDVYRLEMSRLKLSKQEIGVKSLVDNAVSEFQEIIKTQDSKKNIQLNAKLNVSENLKIQCDPQRINQVLGNLIKNSIDFVPSNNGIINIIVDNYDHSQYLDRPDSIDRKKIVFTVEDNGPGIPLDKSDSLFRKFYQIDTSLTRKHGGTGLGLVICKGIVESHGGNIWIDKSYTLGASFKFTLPI